MSLIDVCHDFIKEVASFVSSISLSRRSRFVILDYSVDNEEFVVKIFYDKEQFEHLIDNYTKEVIDKLKQNKRLYDAGWDVHSLVVAQFEASCNYFNDTIFLMVKTF